MIRALRRRILVSQSCVTTFGRSESFSQLRHSATGAPWKQIKAIGRTPITTHRTFCTGVEEQDEKHRTLHDFESDVVPYMDDLVGGKQVREQLPKVDMKDKEIKEQMDSLEVSDADVLEACHLFQSAIKKAQEDPNSRIDPRTAAQVLAWVSAKTPPPQKEDGHGISSISSETVTSTIADRSGAQMEDKISFQTLWNALQTVCEAGILEKDQPASAVLITRSLFPVKDWKILKALTDECVRPEYDSVMSVSSRARALEVVLTLLCERQQFLLADKVLNEIPRYGGSPAPLACLRWMQWLNSQKRYMDALVIFDKMYSMRMHPNNAILNECLMAAQNSGEYETGLSYWRILTRRHTGRPKVAPDTRSYAAFMEIAGRCGLRSQAINALDSMKLKGIPLDSRCYVAAIRACSATGRPQMAFSLYDDMRNEGIGPTKEIFDALAAVAAESASPDLAAESIKELCLHLKNVNEESTDSVIPSSISYKRWIRSVLHCTGAAGQQVRKGNKQRNPNNIANEISNATSKVEQLRCKKMSSSASLQSSSSLSIRFSLGLNQLVESHTIDLMSYCSPFSRFFALHALPSNSVFLPGEPGGTSCISPWTYENDINCNVGSFVNYIDHQRLEIQSKSDKSLVDDYWHNEFERFGAEVDTVTGIPADIGRLPELGLRWLQDFRKLSELRPSEGTSPSGWHYAAVIRSAAAAAEAALPGNPVWAPVVQDGNIYAFCLDSHVAVAEAALSALIEDGHAVPERLLTPLLRIYLRPELETPPRLIPVDLSDDDQGKSAATELNFPASVHWGLWRARYVCSLLTSRNASTSSGDIVKKLLSFFEGNQHSESAFDSAVCEPSIPFPPLDPSQKIPANAEIKAFAPLIRLSGMSTKNYYSAEQLVISILESGDSPSSEIMEALLLASKDAKLPEESWKILKAMIAANYHVTVKTFNIALEAAADCNSSHIATEIVKCMDEHSVQPNSLTFEILSQASAAESVRQQHEEQSRKREEKRPYIERQKEREEQLRIRAEQAMHGNDTTSPIVKTPEASRFRRRGVLFGHSDEMDAEKDEHAVKSSPETISAANFDDQDEVDEEEEEEMHEDEDILHDIETDLGLTEPVAPGGGREWRDLAMTTDRSFKLEETARSSSSKEKPSIANKRNRNSANVYLSEICEDINTEQSQLKSGKKGRKIAPKNEGPLEGLDGMSVVVELDNRPRITVSQLKAWLSNRGIPTSGLKKQQLLSLVRTIAMMSDLLEDYAQTENKQRWILENSFLPNGNTSRESAGSGFEDNGAESDENEAESVEFTCRAPKSPPDSGEEKPSAKVLARALGQVVNGELDHPVVEKLKQVLSPFSRWTMNRTIDMRGQLAARVILDPTIKLGEAGPKGRYEDWSLLELNSLLHLRLLRQATKKSAAIERLRIWDEENAEEVQQMLRQYEEYRGE